MQCGKMVKNNSSFWCSIYYKVLGKSRRAYCTAKKLKEHFPSE